MELTDKVILITGGSGSLGEVVTKKLLEYKPRAIRIYSRGEYLQWEMKQRIQSPLLRFFIGDVRDKERLSRACTDVDILIHAAALKHVDVCEYNPIEAIYTNIDGSINVINAAIDNKIAKVLAISSDKAVHPINLYGATKLCMEKLICQAGVYSPHTIFGCVRFGNFWGSSGSLIPKILRLADNKEPIEVTDAEMSRFWITLDEAAQFTLRACEIIEDGQILLPKMKQRAILEIVKELAPSSEVRFVGKKQGEKLHEMLMTDDELPIDMGDYFLIGGRK